MSLVSEAPVSSDPGGTSPARAAAILVPIAIGAAVSFYGSLHHATGIAVGIAGFSSLLWVKVWTATAAAILAVVQLVTARMMWLPSSGAWVAPVHRWSGRLAFLFTLPVMVHCLYSIGFSTFDLRSLAHSVLGCFFFGAFTAKMLILPKKNLPGWVLPVVGGLVFTALIALWATSSAYMFATEGIRF
jgi:hypothetical protein